MIIHRETITLFGQLYNICIIIILTWSLQLTDRPREKNKDFPVLVFVHGMDFKLGDAQLYPGHILARKEVLVVTFNYRLGALGRVCHVYSLFSMWPSYVRNCCQQPVS